MIFGGPLIAKDFYGLPLPSAEPAPMADAASFFDAASSYLK